MPRYLIALMAVFLCISLPGCLTDKLPTPTPQTTPSSQASPTVRSSQGTPATSGTQSPVPPGTPRTTVGLDMFVSTPGVGTEYAAILGPLGRAYAEDQQLTFTEVQTSLSATLTGDAGSRAQWASRVEKALLAGYKMKSGAFEPIAFDLLKDVLKIEMQGGRTPGEVVQSVLTPGNVIVHAEWRFEDGEPVDTYAVFSADRQPLFDTLLSMPVVDIPMFPGDHF